MKKNALTPSTGMPLWASSMMSPPSGDNAQASNPPAPESPAAFPSHFHQCGGAAFRRQTASAQALLLKNAKSSAQKDPITFCHQFDAEASGLTEKSRIELARLIAKNSSICLARNIRKFKISDAGSMFELAHGIAEKNPEELASHIQDFAIFDESARIKLAHVVAQKKPDSLISHIHDFEIFDESARIELARMVAEKKPIHFAPHIWNFAIYDESARIEFAKIVAKEHASTLADHIQNFAISDERARIELAHIVAEKSPDSLAWRIQDFAISEEKDRIKLAQTIIKTGLSISLINNGYFEKLHISNASARGSLYASVYLGLIAQGKMSATDETWINQFFPRNLEFMHSDSQPMPLAQAAAQSRNRHPVIADLLKTAEQHPDSHIRETLSTWTRLVSLRFAADQLPEATWQHLKPLLEAILKWRAPAMRYVLTHLLTQQCLPPEAKDANSFFAFCRQFTKPHTHLYPALLFRLFQSTPDDPALTKLVTLLHQPSFKDVKQQIAVVNALLALLRANCLPDDLKRSLLQAALPNASDREAVRSLTETAQLMECLVLLAQHSPKLRVNVLQRLKSIGNPGDFNEQLNKVLHDLFPNLSITHDVATCFNRYREYARHPSGLFSYAGKIQNGLAGHEKTGVLTAFDQFINAAVLSPNPEQAFKQLRYDTAKSPHLHLLAERAPEAFAQWRQPCIDHAPSTILVAPSAEVKQTDIVAYLRQRIVMDRHVPAGTYLLLEQVLTGQKTLASALQEGQRQEASASGHAEAGLLQLLNEQTPVKQKANLITELLAVLPQGQFRQDLKDLKELLMPSSRKNAKQFTVVDTDAAEDLFLCGTEVMGSCQNIQGNPKLNKALMGYVLDGKYRMLAIKSEDGRLVGRRMLRLLWDESKQRPVLHLERLYCNPRVPEECEQALVELALQKAKQTNCALVSHDETLPSVGIYPTPLKAYPTPWPFEYVDAENLGVRAGKEPYQLSRAKLVVSPHYSQEPVGKT